MALFNCTTLFSNDSLCSHLLQPGYEAKMPTCWIWRRIVFCNSIKAEKNLWLWQALENFPQLQVFWLDIPVSFLPHLKENPITFHTRIYTSRISKYPFTRTHSCRSTRTTRHGSEAQRAVLWVTSRENSQWSQQLRAEQRGQDHRRVPSPPGPLSLRLNQPFLQWVVEDPFPDDTGEFDFHFPVRRHCLVLKQRNVPNLLHNDDGSTMKVTLTLI